MMVVMVVVVMMVVYVYGMVMVVKAAEASVVGVGVRIEIGDVAVERHGVGDMVPHGIPFHLPLALPVPHNFVLGVQLVDSPVGLLQRVEVLVGGLFPLGSGLGEADGCRG